MDDFDQRAYNKQCAKEYAECMKEVDKGIVLDGEATKQKGSCQYPTDGDDRMLDMPGCGTDRYIEEE